MDWVMSSGEDLGRELGKVRDDGEEDREEEEEEEKEDREEKYQSSHRFGLDIDQNDEGEIEKKKNTPSQCAV